MSLDCKTFAAAAGARSIRIIESKAATIETATEFECRIAEIQEALEIRDEFHTIVFEDLVIFASFVVEVKIVGQAATPATCHFYTHEIILR